MKRIVQLLFVTLMVSACGGKDGWKDASLPEETRAELFIKKDDAPGKGKANEYDAGRLS